MTIRGDSGSAVIECNKLNFKQETELKEFAPESKKDFDSAIKLGVNKLLKKVSIRKSRTVSICSEHQIDTSQAKSDEYG